MDNSSACADSEFGPVHGCRGDFDFSLLFEQTVFSAVPSGVFLFLAAIRLLVLFPRQKKSQRVAIGSGLRWAKLSAVACYGAIEVALLASWINAHPGLYGTRASIAAAILKLVDVFALGALSWLEHSYSPRPSTLLNVYLLVSLSFDAVQTRTLWLKAHDESSSVILIPAEFTAALVIKSGLLVLEVVEKRSLLLPEWRHKTPEETAGVFSRSLLIWLRVILVKGRKTLLAPTDLDPLSEGLGTAHLSRSFGTMWNKQSNRLPRLPLVLPRALRWAIVAPVLPRLAQVAFTLCQPLLLREFLRYLAGEATFVGNTGYAFIITYGLVYLGIAISGCIYWRLTYKSLVKLRGCILAAVYEKTLGIDPARCDTTAAVPLISTDMERIIAGFKDFHEIWANTVQVAISVWLLYRELGLACVAPAVVATVSSLGSMLMSAFADKAQVSWMEATQERVAMTARAVAGMKSIKLLGLTESVRDLLQELRKAELHAARHFRYIEVLTATIAFLPLLLSPVFTFLVFVLQAQSAGEQLDTVKAFTSLGLLQLMTQPLVWLFQAIPLFVASLGCLNRVEKYLHAEPRKTNFSRSTFEVQPEDLPLAEPRSAVVIRAGELGWSETKPVLTDVNINIPASQLTMIIGPVASGKSTLARAIISELPYFRGHIQMFDSVREAANMDIAFCGQEPFIMYGTLLQNITGFSNFDSTWLDSVIHATDLGNDIAALPQGRATNVGSKGTRLSGGQQQRVAIARALYARKRMAIFDDVLSGLDATTKVKVFERAMGPQGLLRQSGCTVVLCTHDVSLLPRADHIIVLGLDGHVAEAGTYEQLREQSSYIKSLVIQEKSSINGDVLREGTSDRAIRDENEANQPLANGDDDSTAAEPADDLTRRLGDASIYKYLASHIGFWRVVVFVALTCGWAVFSTIGTVWLNFWSSAVSGSSDSNGQNGYYLGVYAAFQVLALAFLALFSGFSLTTLAVKAGTSLHHVLLKAMIWAPQSFFGAVDTGNTTNRFSQDIILVDGDMPMSLLETLSAGLVALVQMILIAVAAPYVAIAYPFLLVTLHFVQSFYLRTSRQLRFLDLEARSPLQTNLLETVQGLATIRAFGWAAQSIEANHDLVDASQKPVYLLYMVQRWLQLVLELIIALMAILVAAIAPRMPSTSGGLLGVALIQLMSLSQELKMIVINYTNLETSLTAISRIKAFEKDTPSENHPGDSIALYKTPPAEWPQEGRVSFNAAAVSYVVSGTEKVSFALRDFTLDVAPGQKVAICGRSGSGKSTLIAALTRLADLASGSIMVDGIDVGSVHPSDVRSAINTIPQEPFFFHATVARNLDPTGVLSDDVLRAAVEKVQIWQVIEDAGGLHAAATLDNLSQGQKQLLALCRAILKPSKIVLMDEATSSVDQHTASMMKQVIQDEFKDVTVIAVAHQLSTIMDFDVVVVMDSGYIAEIGNPASLLETKSLFRDLWDSQ
ncbi:ABC transporter atnG [Colletotrichum siamense]|nr:ABC transporter atnG [Colletotrichum siamense]